MRFLFLQLNGIEIMTKIHSLNRLSNHIESTKAICGYLAWTLKRPISFTIYLSLSVFLLLEYGNTKKPTIKLLLISNCQLFQRFHKVVKIVEVKAKDLKQKIVQNTLQYVP
ncbi:1917_t:CDS:2, partial [Gigaspora rosea]